MPIYQTNKLTGELLERAVAQNTSLEPPPFGTMFEDTEFLNKLKGKEGYHPIGVLQRYPHCFDAYKRQPWCPKWKGTLVITGATEVEALLRCWLYAAVGDSIHLDVPFKYVTHYNVWNAGICETLPFTVDQANAFSYQMHDEGLFFEDAAEICRVWNVSQISYFEPVENAQLPQGS